MHVMKLPGRRRETLEFSRVPEANSFKVLDANQDGRVTLRVPWSSADGTETSQDLHKLSIKTEETQDCKNTNTSFAPSTQKELMYMSSPFQALCAAKHRK